MTSRLDAAVAARGLARSRSHAAALIAEGRVSVDGRPVVKASMRVEDDTSIVVAQPDHYVSRAAHKLIAGLDGFGVDVAGRAALDLGASTGGFTQVLRERGATPVVALDVGHGQISATVAADPDVVVVEGFNVRDLTRESLAAASGINAVPDVVTGDLSFISLDLVLGPVAQTASESADVLLLVKPQFEVGRAGVKGGLVSDPAARADAVSGVLWSAWDVGLRTLGVLASPLAGTHGNLEFVIHLARSGGSDPSEWWDTVNRVTGAR